MSNAIEAIYYQPEGDGVKECVIIELVAGPKRYARWWPEVQRIEWGWTLHPTAIPIWEVTR